MKYACVLSVLIACQVCSAEGSHRAVAITFDDLPGPPFGLVSNDVTALRENTAKLLGAVRRAHVPAVGFVNEGKLFLKGESAQRADARIGVLQMWLDAGVELGNHSYSHISLNSTPLEAFEEDVVRGEVVTKRLLSEYHSKLRYFRHPFLQVGLDLGKRQQFEKFLSERGYVIAPVTMENDDYVYANVYADAMRRGDRDAAKRIGADYLRYMEVVFAFDEVVSRRLVGREIRQILLLHANTLNADYFGGLAEILKSRGYRFIPLEEALEDEAYALPDTYVGDWGISWLGHWELSAGRKRSPSPDPPAWISQAYDASAE